MQTIAPSTDPARILLIDDDPAVAAALEEYLQGYGHQVEKAQDGRSAVEQAGSLDPDLIFLDHFLPDCDGLSLLRQLKRSHNAPLVAVLTGRPAIEDAVQSIRLGADEYLSKPISLENIDRILRQLTAKRRVPDAAPGNEPGFVSVPSESMQEMRRKMSLLGHHGTAPILISGETGTGKQQVARKVHALSARARGPFVEIHCGGMPDTLFESELFGYEPGAFTGAQHVKPGLLELAQGGCAFLDEVGELPLHSQAKLLKVLEQRRLRRLGGIKETALDVQIIAATNRDLKVEVAAGRFRADLYYRLNGLHLELPRLADRPGDILILAQHFFAEACQLYGNPLAPLSAEVLAVLQAYPWPGNIRELKNAMQAAVAFCPVRALRPVDLPAEVRHPAAATAEAAAEERIPSRAEADRQTVMKALKLCGGNKSAAARLLGITRQTVAKISRQAV